MSATHQTNAKTWLRETASRARTDPLHVSAGLKQGDYSRSHFYTALILIWTACVGAYVIVLEKAVNNHDFLGKRGEAARDENFDKLAFLRAAFASIHVPVIVSVLASTVPYWTMTSPDGVTAAQTTAELAYEEIEMKKALAYVGFPILSIAYVTESSQYWDAQSLDVAVSLGGSNMSYETALDFMQDPSRWVGEGLFSAAPGRFIDIGDLLVLNASVKTNDPYTGLSFDHTFWSDGDSILTRLELSSKEQFQMSLAAVQVKALCTLAYYNDTVFLPQYSIGPEAELDFDYGDQLSCKLNCSGVTGQEGAICISNSTTLPMCPTNSTLAGTSSCFSGQALSCGKISETSSTQLAATAHIQFAVHNRFKYTAVRTCDLSLSFVRPVANTLIGEYVQATADQSEQSDTSLQNPQGLTPLQLLHMSVVGPMSIFHNGPPRLTNDTEFTAITDGFKWVSWLSDQGARDLSYSRTQTVILTGPNNRRTSIPQKRSPQTSTTNTPLTTAVSGSVTSDSGVTVIESLGPVTQAYGTENLTIGGGLLFGSGTKTFAVYTASIPDTAAARIGGNPWDLLQIRPTPTQAGVIYVVSLADNSPEGNSLYKPSYLNEDIFLKPLLYVVTKPGFFTTGTTGAVVFKTDIIQTRGRVPWRLAVIILMTPLLWTFILTIMANRRKRWTASLDAWAIFRLGSDWRGHLQHLRFAGLRESKEELQSVPGLIYIDPDEGIVELAHPVKTTFGRGVHTLKRRSIAVRGTESQQIVGSTDGEENKQAKLVTGRSDMWI
ncbi:hypothetical protein LTR05_008174 [Lithohypha guttulata]|uniref:Uncharacterized protein n=1 Tax=Lithohypha guttulata TaxID=1690604 RepID=A0AAN7YDA0_9EURO|nr:hypothetical protein LTR05_008174 [Lithohypha guttulata]